MGKVNRVTATLIVGVCLFFASGQSLPAPPNTLSSESNTASCDVSTKTECADTDTNDAMKEKEERLQMMGGVYAEKINSFEKAIQMQSERISDISLSINLFGIFIALLSLVLGLLGYFSVAKRAKDEAVSVAKKEAGEWLNGVYAEKLFEDWFHKKNKDLTDLKGYGESVGESEIQENDSSHSSDFSERVSASVSSSFGFTSSATAQVGKRETFESDSHIELKLAHLALLFEQKNYQNAISIANEVMSHPDCSDKQFALAAQAIAMCYVEEKNTMGALSVIGKAIARPTLLSDEEGAGIWLELRGVEVVCHELDGNFKKAISVLEEVANKKLSVRYKGLQSFVMRLSLSHANLLYKVGSKLFAKQIALGVFSDISQDSSNSAKIVGYRSLSVLAAWSLSEGKYDEVLEVCDKALSDEGVGVRAFAERVYFRITQLKILALILSGRVSDAEEIAKRTIEDLGRTAADWAPVEIDKLQQVLKKVRSDGE